MRCLFYKGAFMKIIKKTYDEFQKNCIKDLALSTGISEFTVEILYGRGYDTASKIEEFLSPNSQPLFSPYTLSGMDDAVDRIIKAKDNGETVVIYGDYDADGICATTLLYNALQRLGINVHAVIPERENGYGLTEGVLSDVLENLFPDLIITVDCGISAKKEVEYLQDLGVDVIVTDHHEFPTELPDCTIVSTKTPNQEYPFEYLSGTGVAYQVAKALIGDEADGFLDLVAVATIADSMPLTGENRILVYKGIELIKSGKCSKAITMLLTAGGAKEINSGTLAFTVAPRINAAGRMGDAYSALKLLLTKDSAEREELVSMLVKYNVDRQVECEELYKSAKTKLKTSGNYGNVIVLCENSWKGGLLGIVAARLTEEYNLPTVLFSEIDGRLHGSARSIGDINVYEAISSTKELLIDYGGHAQAAGVTINQENLSLFANRLSEYINANYDEGAFEKTMEVDGVISQAVSLKTAKEIVKLEPFGTGNKKPVFLLSTNSSQAKLLKEGSNHVTVKSKELDMIFFNGVKYLDALSSNFNKDLIVEISTSNYGGREYVKGFIKKVFLSFEVDVDGVYKAFKNALLGLIGGVNYLGGDDVESIIKTTAPNGFGRLFIITNPENYNAYNELKNFEVCPFNLTVKGGKNAVLIGADLLNTDLSSYEELVFIDKPLGEIYAHKNQKIYVSSLNSFDLSGVKIEREVLGEIFRDICVKARSGMTYQEIVFESNNEMQTIFALEVFKELDFLEESGFIFIKKSEKKDLVNSKIYKAVLEIKNA